MRRGPGVFGGGVEEGVESRIGEVGEVAEFGFRE